MRLWNEKDLHDVFNANQSVIKNYCRLFTDYIVRDNKLYVAHRNMITRFFIGPSDDNEDELAGEPESIIFNEPVRSLFRLQEICTAEATLSTD